MKYMLVIYGSEKAWSALDRNDGERIGSAHKALQAELANTGELVDHMELALDDAIVVRRSDDRVERTEGPLDAGGQLLGGYYVVDCVDRARAVEIAARFEEAKFAPIEVRRLRGGTTWDSGKPSTGR
jgi:hypothetical protein